MSRKPIHAPAISRMLNHAGIRKAPTENTWGQGFVVVGYGVEVEVTYQDTDQAQVRRNLDAIRETINANPKYLAITSKDSTGELNVVKVVIRPDEDKIEAVTEKLAEESPNAVTKAEIADCLKGCFRFTGNASGYEITREPAPDDRMVRVTYRDTPHTSYSEGTGGRDKYSHDRVQHYFRLISEAGYAAMIDYDEVTNTDSVLVGVRGEFGVQDSPEEIEEALNALRKAVEADDIAYMTRKAGDHSIFVYFLVPFRDKLRRCEVFWTGGVYKLCPRFGGPMREYYNREFLVEEIGRELNA